MPDLSRICDLHRSPEQHWILNPLSRARDRTHACMDTSWVCYHWTMMGTPLFFFSFYLSFFLSYKIPQISNPKWYLFVFLISLCIMPSKFIHIFGNGRISFFLLAEEYSMVEIFHIFFTYSTTDGLLGCFHTLAIVNKAAMNMEEQISSWYSLFIFFGCISRSGIAGSCGSSIFNFYF